MERELRIKAFMEEYARLAQLFEDIVTMKNALLRLELYMVVMVGQIACAVTAVGLFLLCRLYQSHRQRGEYELEHRFERKCASCDPSTKTHNMTTSAGVPALVKKPV